MREEVDLLNAYYTFTLALKTCEFVTKIQANFPGIQLVFVFRTLLLFYCYYNFVIILHKCQVWKQFWFDNLRSKSIHSGLPNCRYTVRTNKPGGFILPILCLKQQNTKQREISFFILICDQGFRITWIQNHITQCHSIMNLSIFYQAFCHHIQKHSFAFCVRMFKGYVPFRLRQLC